MSSTYERHISADATDDEPLGGMRVVAAAAVAGMLTTAVVLAYVASLAVSWLGDNRPDACAQYRGAEVAACIAELGQ